MIEMAHATHIRQELQNVPLLRRPDRETDNAEFAIGIQTVGVDELAAIIDGDPAFLSGIFTPEELDYCNGKKTKSKKMSLAGRLAGKLAVVQAYGFGMPWQDIAILPSPEKRPMVQLRGKAAQLAEERGGVVGLSITHDHELAVALAVHSETKTHLGVGIDIVSVSRIAGLSDHFIERHFTEQERQHAGDNPEKLAEQWVVKEAITKALGTGMWRDGVAMKPIETITNPDGGVSISLDDNVLKLAQRKKLHTWDVHVVPNPHTPIAFVIGY